MRGIYLLLLEVKKKSEIEIGALGKIKFEPGTYTYVGSALNGIEQRVSRHLSSDKKLHWHIDYLLKEKDVRIEKALYKETKNKEKECETARRISEFGKPIRNFGCSDCDCESHLFLIKDKKKLENLPMGKLNMDEMRDNI